MDRDSLSHHDFEIIYIWFVKISSVIVDKKKVTHPDSRLIILLFELDHVPDL